MALLYDIGFFAFRVVILLVSLLWLLPVGARCNANLEDLASLNGHIQHRGRYSWRGYMLDCARHFFTVDEIKTTLDTMHLFGLNVFHWHLTDSDGWRLEIERYPELTRVGAVRPSRPRVSTMLADETIGLYGPFFYSKKDVSEVVRYAAERGIRVVPEIDMPGHSAAAIRAYPKLGCDGTFHGSELCVGKDATLRMYENIIEEVMDMFPDHVIHLGGDECSHESWRRCRYCQRRICEERLRDEKDLQAWVSIHFARFLESHGRRMLAWDDVLDAEDLPRSVIIMPYRSQKRLGIEAVQRGHDVVEASDSFCYLDYVQGLKDDPYEYQPFGGTVSWKRISQFDPMDGYPPELRKKVLGAEGCLWTELVCDFKGVEWRTWPRMAAMAEVLLNGPASSDDEFEGRMLAAVEKLKAHGVNVAPVGPAISDCLALEPGVRCSLLRPDFAKLLPCEIAPDRLTFDVASKDNPYGSIFARQNTLLPSGAFVVNMDWMRVEVEASDALGFTNACRQIRALARSKANDVMEFPACRLEGGDVPFCRLPLDAMAERRVWTNEMTGVATVAFWHEPRHMQLGANYPMYIVDSGDRDGIEDLLNSWRRDNKEAFLLAAEAGSELDHLVDWLCRRIRPLDKNRIVKIRLDDKRMQKENK